MYAFSLYAAVVRCVPLSPFQISHLLFFLSYLYEHFDAVSFHSVPNLSIVLVLLALYAFRADTVFILREASDSLKPLTQIDAHCSCAASKVKSTSRVGIEEDNPKRWLKTDADSKTERGGEGRGCVTTVDSSACQSTHPSIQLPNNPT